MVINTASGKKSGEGSGKIRRAVLRYSIPYSTTLAGAWAMASGIERLKRGTLSVRSLQEFHNDEISRAGAACGK